MSNIEDFLLEKIEELDRNVKDSMHYKGLRGRGYEHTVSAYPENYEVKVEEWLEQVRDGVDELKGN